MPDGTVTNLLGIFHTSVWDGAHRRQKEKLIEQIVQSDFLTTTATSSYRHHGKPRKAVRGSQQL